jgi:hypothetical protein
MIRSSTLLFSAALGLLGCTPRYDGRDHLTKTTGAEEAWKICRIYEAKLEAITGYEGWTTFHSEFAAPATETQKAAVGCLVRWQALHGNYGSIHLNEQIEGKNRVEQVDLSDYD